VRLSLIRFLAAAACLPAAFAVDAQRIDGQILLQVCQGRLDGRSAMDSGLCLGTIAGALDAHDGLLATDEALYCLRERKLSNDQVVRLVVRWLREHPEHQARSAATAVVFALRDSYPCGDAAAPPK
jgi:hypothetical protein